MTKLLAGKDVAGFIQERHAQTVRGLLVAPKLAIVRQGATPATDAYLRVKKQYGADIGVMVDTYTEAPADLMARIAALNADPSVTGIIVQLPFADQPDLAEQALAAVAPAKDVDGLSPHSPFEAATPKAILWLLAAYNVDLSGRRIAVVGQGRLVGAPLADRLDASGHDVARLDEHTPNLAAALHDAGAIITATGQPGLITSAMVADGAIVVDAASPRSDLARDLFDRADLIITPNPGGVGPMTVASLFDNLLIAAQTRHP
ncbi:MAG TPA: bifunctional 5,10-methylenetetrahydrofolate dehydrogenase/5,10-methenyltetrahydrofolate cyclohydrolase [Candidatus Saccharimonadia bacterium]|nr:bifunctional 5,10-methylenetetrahydrofolate dehydrogenase/5,10-methenyltetrahydrofolate cyclohydrolase [Candidatus Saccharimonadia bacterium]